MIYLLGASHMGVVVSAWAHPDETGHQKFGAIPPHFIKLRSKFNDDNDFFWASSIYIGHYAPFWGDTLVQKSSNGSLNISPGFKDLINSITPDEENSLFLFMTGEEHFHLGRMKHDPEIDFEIPWRHDLIIQDGRQVIPYNIIENQVTAHLNNALMNLLVIRRLLPAMNIFNVICPPPINYQNTQKKDLPINIGDKNGEISTNETIRLKYYIIYCHILSQFTEKIGITPIFPPQHTVSANGYLKNEYARDKIHGNTAYGNSVIDQIKAFNKGS
jgi:hypothetical protein